MTVLQELRKEQERLAKRSSTLNGVTFTKVHRQWLALQRKAIAMHDGDLCMDHGFKDCRICKPGFIPRTDHGAQT